MVQITVRRRNNDDYAFGGYVSVSRAYAINGLNQYTSAGPAVFSYDANGNLIGDGTRSFGYDVENRLVSSGAVTLAYDPLGRLWQTSGGASGTTQFLYDGDALVAEYDGDTGALRRRYMHGPGVDETILWDEGAGMNCSGTRFLHTDHQGSVAAVADCSGNRIAVDTYDEYGIPGSGNVGRFQYTGQAWIPELGLYYYKARIYSPTLGRFLQTDPIGYDDQNNLYAYVANDPVNGRDPSGNQREPTFQEQKRQIEAQIEFNREHPSIATGMAIGAAVVMTGGTAAVLLPEAAAGGVAVATARAGATAATESGATGGATTGLVTRAGQVFEGASTRAGGPGAPTNAAVQAAADSVPAAARSPFHGCCGEVNAMSNAANAGARLEGAVAATVRATGRAAGELMQACSSCRAIAEKLGVKLIEPK